MASRETSYGANGAESLTIGEAAEALGVSVETLRRWSDSGQIRSERTSGGHRRFLVSDVQRALERHGSARSRSFRLDPPARPLPSLASLLKDDVDLLGSARRALYARGPRGWFASEAGKGRTERWLAEVAEAAATGRYEAAISGSCELAKQARVSGVSLLECDSFFELLGAAIARELGNRAPRERATARLLLIVLRQSMLDTYQGVQRGGTEAGSGSPDEAAIGDSDGSPAELSGSGRGPAEGAALAWFLEELVDIYDVEDGAVYLTGPEGMDLRLAAFSSARHDRAGRAPDRIALGEGPIGKVALEQRAQMLRAPAWSASGEGRARPLLAAPLRDGTRLVGVICLGARASRPVEDRELLLLGALADRIAPAAAGGAGDPSVSLKTALARFRTAWSSAAAD